MNDKEFFNNIADKWDSMCNHPEHKIQYILDKIDLKSGFNILDIGSGTGITLPFLEEKINPCGNIVALDFAENMLAIAKNKYLSKYSNIRYIVEDFYEYNSNIKFDCILAYSCYPHFKDKKKFFIKANSLLKQNGKLVIAHIESKEKINNRHKGIKGKLTSDILPCVETTVNIIKDFRFKSTYTEDNDDYYICICEKIENC